MKLLAEKEMGYIVIAIPSLQRVGLSKIYALCVRTNIYSLSERKTHYTIVVNANVELPTVKE